MPNGRLTGRIEETRIEVGRNYSVWNKHGGHIKELADEYGFSDVSDVMLLKRNSGDLS